MMALANLLSHPVLGDITMSQPIGGREILRSAKDLGRVLALAYLAGREETETWLEPWREAIQECFPETWQGLVGNAGQGLRELLANAAVIEEARHTCEVGLLQGRGVGVDALKATGERLLVDLIELFEKLVAGG